MMSALAKEARGRPDTYASWESKLAKTEQLTVEFTAYNCNLAPKVILNFTCLDCIRRIFVDDLEEFCIVSIRWLPLAS